MATIQNLHKSLTKLSFDDALARILLLRQSRLTVKPNSKFVQRSTNNKPKTPKVSKTRTKRNPLEGVSKAELLEMLKEF